MVAAPPRWVLRGSSFGFRAKTCACGGPGGWARWSSASCRRCAGGSLGGRRCGAGAGPTGAHTGRAGRNPPKLVAGKAGPTDRAAQRPCRCLASSLTAGNRIISACPTASFRPRACLENDSVNMILFPPGGDAPALPWKIQNDVYRMMNERCDVPQVALFQTGSNLRPEDRNGVRKIAVRKMGRTEMFLTAMFLTSEPV